MAFFNGPVKELNFMRHLKAGRKLNRNPSHRLALMRNMVTSLLQYERIETTDAKAKALRRWVDWMIGLGKRGDLHARRQALSVIQDKAIVHKLFDSLAARFKSRPGGYTRIVKIGWRHGDSAPISVIELMPGEADAKAAAAPKKKAKKTPPKKEQAPAKGKSRTAKAAAKPA
jgi:large subunit ribosomal protein L17